MSNSDTATNLDDAPIVNDEAPQQEVTAPAEGDGEPDDFSDLAKEGLGDEAEPEFADVEYEGQTHRVPAALKDALLRQADYTRKTTELARERETIATTRQEAESYRNIGAAVIEATAQSKALEFQIKAYSEQPIDGLDDGTIARMENELIRMQQQKGQIDNDVRQLIEADRSRASDEVTKAQREAIDAAKMVIPNFDDKRKGELEALAVNQGISPEDAKTITEPGVYKILHLADIGQKFLDRQRAARKVENATRPVPEVGGKATASNDPERMSTAEWMKRRNSEVGT
jgi:hypothetical protein